MNKKKIFLIIILLLIIVAEIVAIFFVLPKSGDSNNSNNVVVDEDYYKNIDITNELDDRYDLPAEDYYKKYYKIIDTIKADKSNKNILDYRVIDKIDAKTIDSYVIE